MKRGKVLNFAASPNIRRKTLSRPRIGCIAAATCPPPSDRSTTSSVKRRSMPSDVARAHIKQKLFQRASRLFALPGG